MLVLRKNVLCLYFRQQLQNNFGVADRIRLQAERHHPAYVRERNFTPLSRGDSHALGIKSTAVVPDRDLVTNSITTKSSQSRVSSSLRSVHTDSPYIPRPPNRRYMRLISKLTKSWIINELFYFYKSTFYILSRLSNV